MPKNIVVCCDGTGNEVSGNLSNVLKLFRIVEKSAAQRVFYNPGIGTISTDDAWTRFKQDAKGVFGLATGYGLDHDVLTAYRFIAETYEDGDAIFMFGFSRGAYTVRMLAGFTHMVGLLPPDQLNICEYALTSYKRASEDNKLSIGFDFGHITGARRVPIKFIGVWDTVASIIVPRRDRLLPTLQTMPYTRRNPSVEVFRQAIAIDERRRMFRLNRWTDPQPYIAPAADAPASKPVSHPDQNIRQVWFSGVHSDVGGGYPEDESAPSKYPLSWMIEQATAAGLQIDEQMRDHLVLGQPRPGGRHQYAAPAVTTALHNSLRKAWRILEWVPKAVKWREWKRKSLFGWYLPRGEPRVVVSDGTITKLHQSVIDRLKADPSYRPENLPPGLPGNIPPGVEIEP